MRLGLFAKDAVVYGLGNIGLRTASLLLTPVYTYFLSMEDYGLWATLQITIQTMLILMNVGMRETTIRFTKDCEESNRVKDLLGTSTVIVLIAGALIGAVSVLGLPFVFRSVLHQDEVHELIVLTCAAALAQSLSIQLMSYYRANNQSARYITVGLSGSLLLLVSTLVTLCVLDLGVVGVLWAYIATYTLVYLAVAVDVFPKTGVRVSVNMFPFLLGFGAPLIFSAAGQAVIYGVSLYLLSYAAGLETVAVFSLGYKLATLMAIGVFLPFQLAFQPFIYSNLNSPDIRQHAARLLTYLVLATTAFGFIIIVASRTLLPWIAPPEYRDAFLVTLWLLPGQALIGLHYFGETLLGAVRRTATLAVLNSTCGALCVGLSLALIPRFGWYGAVAATTASAIVADTIELGIGFRCFRLASEVEWARLAFIAAVFLAQLGVGVALEHAPLPAFIGGMAVFAVLMAGLLWLGPFWNVQERRALKGAAGRMGSLLTARGVSS